MRRESSESPFLSLSKLHGKRLLHWRNSTETPVAQASSQQKSNCPAQHMGKKKKTKKILIHNCRKVQCVQTTRIQQHSCWYLGKNPLLVFQMFLLDPFLASTLDRGTNGKTPIFKITYWNKKLKTFCLESCG